MLGLLLLVVAAVIFGLGAPAMLLFSDCDGVGVADPYAEFDVAK